MQAINTFDQLYPPFAEQQMKFQERLKAEGIPAFPFETYRPIERQLELYAKGRVCKDGKWIIIHPELIVTRAFPGLSCHEYGCATDWVFDGNTQKQGIQWSWDDDLPWADLGRIGEECGLEWYGNPAAAFHEMPHFQNRYGLQIHQMHDLYQAGGMTAVWKAFDDARKFKVAA